MKEKGDIRHSCEHKLRFVLFPPPYSSRQAASAPKTTQLTFPPAPPSRFCSRGQTVLNHASSLWDLQEPHTNACHNYTGTRQTDVD